METYFDGTFYYIIDGNGFCRVEDRWSRLEVTTEDSLDEALSVTKFNRKDLQRV